MAMECKYCKKNKKLIKAHILPRKFYTNYEKDGYQAVKIDGSYEIFQCGFYNNNILCADCDGKILKLYDDEAYRLLLDIENKKEKSTINDLSVYHYSFSEFDYNKIRKFFIALLWKASITKSKFYNSVDLGPYEKIALDILQDNNTHDNLFKIVVLKEPEFNDLTGVHFFQNLKYKRQNLYAIYFNQYIALIFPKYQHQNKFIFEPFEKIMLSKDEFIICETDGLIDKKLNYLFKFKNGIAKREMKKKKLN